MISFNCILEISRRIRRQTSLTYLTVVIREDPPATLSSWSTSLSSISINSITSTAITNIQCGGTQEAWTASTATGGTAPTTIEVQEPGNQTSVSLSTVATVRLITVPSNCNQGSPCGVQPVLVAYDGNGNVIQSLGSNNQPWQVQITIIGQPSVRVMGGIANYANGQTQFTRFGVSATGSYSFEFRFVTNGCTGR